MAGHFFVQSFLFLRIYVLKELRRSRGMSWHCRLESRRPEATGQTAACPVLPGSARPCPALSGHAPSHAPGHAHGPHRNPATPAPIRVRPARPESAPRRRPHVQAATETFLLSIRSRQTESRITPGQIHFEMLNISRFSLSRKCDFRPNPRHAVARCAFVQH